MIRFLQVFLLTAIVVYPSASVSAYKGSQAYNQLTHTAASVNTATGTFRFSYPLIVAAGIHSFFRVQLNYHFNSEGMFGLPTGWQLDVDHIKDGTAVMGGQQWLIDPLWHDESLFASGLKYYNQHGTRFIDAGEEQKIPAEPARFYRYKSEHKDGSEKYFSRQGLLVLQQDRFGNRITIDYEQPVHSAAAARLTAIVDNYGNRYTFVYEPHSLIVNYPDGKLQRVYFTEHGVSTIVDPMQQRYELTYTEVNHRQLLKTILTPKGLLTELNYSTIPYLHRGGESNMPVVSYFKQSEADTEKIYHETFYSHSQDSNYTGYPLYSLSDSTDNLVDSNNQSYRYVVEVRQSDGDPQKPTFHHKIYEYNFLHLPVEIRTLKQGQNFTKTELTYSIQPFRYSRSTNYDKPTTVVFLNWDGEQYIPINRVDHTYDLFGNSTGEEHWVYHLSEAYWRPVRSVTRQYFTEHFSLLAATTDRDRISGNAVKTQYCLSPSKKNHATIRTYASGNDRWQPWQQTNFAYDTAGRETFRELKWIAKNMPGVQKTHKKTRYLLGESGLLTTWHENSLGHVSQKLTDTRNSQLLMHVSPLGEKTQYRYNALNQLIERTDPEGNIDKIEHYTHANCGINATVHKSPLGFTTRKQTDPLGRVTVLEQAIDDHYQVMEERQYNAFGKLAWRKDRFGQLTCFRYDGQMRLSEHTDPWQNKTAHIYDEKKLSQHIFLNDKKYKQINLTPWLLTTQTIHYPLGNSTTAVENQSNKNGFDQVMYEHSALLNNEQRTHKITNTYQYDPGHNKIKTETKGFDGIRLTKTATYDLFNRQHTFAKLQTANGETSRHQGYRYFYNSENQLERVVSPPSQNGETLIDRHRYDQNGREIEHQLPDGHRIKKTYTPRGKLESMSWTRNGQPYRVFYQYDADGRLTHLTDKDGQQQHYEYDRRGNLIRHTYPDKRQQKYSYDPMNRLTQQENVSNTTLTYHYDPKDKGKLSSIHSAANRIHFTYGKDDNGVQGRLLAIDRDIVGVGKTREKKTYGDFGRLTKSEVHADDGRLIYASNYQFLPRGELIKQTTHSTKDNQPVTRVDHYDYDALKRLTAEVHYENGNPSAPAIGYQYDGNNNLIEEQRSPNSTIHRHYNAADQLVSITGEKTTVLTHDANGHVIVDHEGNQYQYDDLGLLQSITDANGKTLASFHYLPNGLLGRLHSGNDRQDFYYDTNSRAITVFNNQQRYDFIQHRQKYLATLTATGGEQLFTTNQSTGARLGLNAKGEKTTNIYSYEGYGQSIAGDNPSGNNFLWNQELTEKMTGVVYLKNRFYHPQLRRFTSRDKLKVENRYSYANANPIGFVDPMGQSSTSTGVLIGLGAAIALLGLGIAFYWFPPAGVTFSTEAVIGLASAALTTGSGLSLAGSQYALNSGNKNIGQALKITSGALGFMALLTGLIAIFRPAFIEEFSNTFEMEFNRVSVDVNPAVESESVAMKPISDKFYDSPANSLPDISGRGFYNSPAKNFYPSPAKSYDDLLLKSHSIGRATAKMEVDSLYSMNRGIDDSSSSIDESVNTPTASLSSWNHPVPEQASDSLPLRAFTGNANLGTTNITMPVLNRVLNADSSAAESSTTASQAGQFLQDTPPTES